MGMTTEERETCGGRRVLRCVVLCSVMLLLLRDCQVVFAGEARIWTCCNRPCAASMESSVTGTPEATIPGAAAGKGEWATGSCPLGSAACARMRQTLHHTPLHAGSPRWRWEQGSRGLHPLPACLPEAHLSGQLAHQPLVLWEDGRVLQHHCHAHNACTGGALCRGPLGTTRARSSAARQSAGPGWRPPGRQMMQVQRAGSLGARSRQPNPLGQRLHPSRACAALGNPLACTPPRLQAHRPRVRVIPGPSPISPASSTAWRSRRSAGRSGARRTTTASPVVAVAGVPPSGWRSLSPAGSRPARL